MAADEAISQLGSTFQNGYSTANLMALVDVTDTSMGGTGAGTDKQLTVASFLSHYVSTTGLTSVGLAVPVRFDRLGISAHSQRHYHDRRGREWSPERSERRCDLGGRGGHGLPHADRLGRCADGAHGLADLAATSAATRPRSRARSRPRRSATSRPGRARPRSPRSARSAPGTWQGTAIGSSYLTPPAGSGNLVYNNGGAFAAASQLSIEAAGQINYAPVSDPGSPSAGDLWYSSAANTFGFMSKGMVTRAGGVIWQATSAGTALANSASQYSLLTGTYGPGSTLGSLVIPANSLKVGAIIRPTFFGGMTVASGTPNIQLSLWLGGNLIWGIQSGGLTSAAVSSVWCLNTPAYMSPGLMVQSIGASGTITGVLAVSVVNASYSNETIGGGTSSAVLTNNWVTPVAQPINTTNSLTIDFQVKWSSANSSNSIQILGGYITIDG